MCDVHRIKLTKVNLQPRADTIEEHELPQWGELLSKLGTDLTLWVVQERLTLTMTLRPLKVLQQLLLPPGKPRNGLRPCTTVWNARSVLHPPDFGPAQGEVSQ